MAVDPALSEINGKQTCFHVWRIERMVVVPVSKQDYGKFYDGDSYIIYSASEEGQEAGANIDVRDIDGHVDELIHFWRGDKSSTDEQGVAAFKVT
jgi:hypothetical protein